MATPEPDQQAVLVTRGDGSTCRIGPIHLPHIAERLMDGFAQQRHSVAGAAEATWRTIDYDPAQPHFPLLPADAMSLMVLMDHPTEGVGNDCPFPDLFSRLIAQHGPEGTEAWNKACAYMGAEETAAEQAAEPVIVHWDKQVTHEADGGAIVHCLAAADDPPEQSVALHLDADDREALGASLHAPDAPADGAQQPAPQTPSPAAGQFTETALLHAVMYGSDDQARRLAASMLPAERATLAQHLQRTYELLADRFGNIL